MSDLSLSVEGKELENLDRRVEHFRKLVNDRRKKEALAYYNGQSEAVKKAIEQNAQYDLRAASFQF